MKATNFLFFLVLAVRNFLPAEMEMNLRKMLFQIIAFVGRSILPEDNLREEVESLRHQIKEKYDEGKLEEARELQDLLRDKVQKKFSPRLKVH